MGRSYGNYSGDCHNQGLTPGDALDYFTTYIEDLGVWGGLFYVAFYSIRSLVFSLQVFFLLAPVPFSDLFRD
ncbi:MAG: hypothetical protein ABFS18_11530 [Thermodesulfobacteriota bacterium]